MWTPVQTLSSSRFSSSGHVLVCHSSVHIAGFGIVITYILSVCFFLLQFLSFFQCCVFYFLNMFTFMGLLVGLHTYMLFAGGEVLTVKNSTEDFRKMLPEVAGRKQRHVKPEISLFFHYTHRP